MPIPPYIENEELQLIIAMVKPKVAKVNEELQWLSPRVAIINMVNYQMLQSLMVARFHYIVAIVHINNCNGSYIILHSFT